jgi:hypothetical protein
MRYIIIALFLILSACKTTSMYDMERFAQECMERGYFNGQIDACNGSIKIQERNGKWIWIATPWNDGEAPSWSNK